MGVACNSRRFISNKMKMDNSLLRLGEFCFIPCIALVSIIARTFRYNPKGDIGYKQVTDIGREDDKDGSLQLEAVLLRNE